MFTLGPAFFYKAPAATTGGGSTTNYVASSNQVTPQGALALPAIVSAYSDEGTIALAVPFSFKFFGKDYGNGANSGIYVCANDYIGFGPAKSEYYYFAANNPGPGIFIGSSDRAWQKVYGGVEGDTYRVRFEGPDGYTNTTTNVYWEMTFYPNGVLQLVIGTYTGLDNASNLKKISDGSTYTNTLALAQNTSYAFVPDATGSNWVVTQGSIVAA